MLYDPKWSPPETEIKLEPWQEAMLKAADLLERKGWIQGRYYGTDGYCMMGALRVENIKEEHRTRAELTHHLGTIPEKWNDMKHRTKEEVISKLREVAHAV